MSTMSFWDTMKEIEMMIGLMKFTLKYVFSREKYTADWGKLHRKRNHRIVHLGTANVYLTREAWTWRNLIYTDEGDQGYLER